MTWPELAWIGNNPDFASSVAGQLSARYGLRVVSYPRHSLDALGVDTVVLATDVIDIFHAFNGLPTLCRESVQRAYDKYMVHVKGFTNMPRSSVLANDDNEVHVVASALVELALRDSWDHEDSAISVEERRKLEVFLREVSRLAESSVLGHDGSADALASAESIQVELRAANPDRNIIRRNLRRLGKVGGAILLGVAGNYFTDLVQLFHVPWPK